ncbi:MAG: tripartite tricarboxylate transporter TctB family protein [Synergistaceae bacterium]|jgi:hypothetical protein|nr:tripartite tricarboxylate transporter TctB family protein [Synergistaceae bacterium]
MEDVAKEQDLSVYIPEKTRKPGEIGFALLGILFGILGYYFAMDMTSDSYSAPSVFPKVSSTIIIVCGLTCLLKALMKAKSPAEAGTAFHYLLPKDVVFALVMLVVYCVALPYAHFIPASYAFMVVGMVYLHRGKKIAQSLFVSALALALLVGVFRYVFMVMLP